MKPLRDPALYANLALLVELKNDEGFSAKDRQRLAEYWSFWYELWQTHWRVVVHPHYAAIAAGTPP